MVAVMAPGARGALPRPVDGQGDAAIRAVERRAALAAEHRCGEAPTVEQQQRLLVPPESALERLDDRGTEDDLRSLVREHLAHVDDADGRQRAIEHAVFERDELIPAVERMMIAFHGRRGGTQDHQRPGLPRAHDRQVACVVSRRLLLFVGVIVLLVDDDEAGILERREDRRTCAHDDIDCAAADAVPLVVAFAVREPAMLHSDAIAEDVTKHRGHGWRQGNLRNENEHRAPGGPRLGRQPEVQLRLTATGYAVQQCNVEMAGPHVHPQAAKRVHLFGRQVAPPRGAALGRGPTAGGQRGRRDERVALASLVAHGDETTAFETLHGLRTNAALSQDAHGEAVRRATKGRKGGSLPLAKHRDRGRLAAGIRARCSLRECLPFDGERDDAHRAKCGCLASQRACRRDQAIAQQPAEYRVDAAAHATGNRPDLSCAGASALRDRSEHHDGRTATIAARRRQPGAASIRKRDAPFALDPRKRGHGRSDGLAGTRDVVLGRPQREIDDVSRQERRIVEYLQHRPELHAWRYFGNGPDHASRHLPRTERHEHPRPPHGWRHPIRNVVREKAEKGNRNGYEDGHSATHDAGCTMHKARARRYTGRGKFSSMMRLDRDWSWWNNRLCIVHRAFTSKARPPSPRAWLPGCAGGRRGETWASRGCRRPDGSDRESSRSAR